MYRNQLQKFIGILVVVALTIALHFLGWLSPVENSIRSLLQPGSKLLYQLSLRMQQENLPFTDANQFIAHYKNLSIEIDEYKQKAIQYEVLSDENSQLREQLHFFTSTTLDHVGAEVIGKNIEPLANTLVLSRGESDGVQVGDAVIVNNGILVGKILRVEKDMSIARLLNDPQSKVAATVLNQSKSIGLVEGGYGISVRMNFVPQNELIAPGDTVITSGLEKQIPRGLILGTVETVQKEAYEPFQQAVLTPGAPLDKIYIVSILIHTQNQTH